MIEAQPMLDQPAWLLGSTMVIALAAALCHASRKQRRTARQAFQGTTAAEAPDIHLAPTIEAAELLLAMLSRRMRIYLRDPYDYAGSRIKDDMGFEDCLDLAVRLSMRIGDLSGAATAGPSECERVRGQIVEGLMHEWPLDQTALHQGPSAGS
jgi:hypothetical protein